MSIDMFTTVTRAGNTVTGSPILVQSDLMNQQDARAYGGAQAGEAPYFRYNQFTDYPITLLQGDKLTDTVNTDPKTGTNTVYRIIGDVEKFLDGHSEWVADRVIGT